jgi:ABC-2 type transport system ATP-binding protein
MEGWPASENPQGAVLEVDGLVKLYRNGRGVSRMSFALGKGDVFGLLGSNGSGKTTAIKSICGLCPFKGDIRLFGVSVAADPRAALRRLGCVVEAPSFYGSLSAERNLLLAASYHGMRRREALEAAGRALESVGLSKFRKERAERFSLGMKARLALALCFVAKPDFLALDEPLNGLDIEGMVEIRNLITSLAARSGATFLISSHLAAEVEKTCNRVGVMDEGELLGTSSMDDALREHGSVEAYYLSTLERSKAREKPHG